MTIRAVLFDAGGTLLRVRGSVGDVYARIAARHAVSIASADLDSRFAEVFGAAAPLCFPHASNANVAELERDWWRQLVRQVFAHSRFDDFEAFFDELFGYFAVPNHWEVYADTVPALRALRARGLRLAILSNFDARLFHICDGLDLTRYFDSIVVSGRAGCAKPDARIFAATVSRLGVEPAEAMHVGDDEIDDVSGARAAGLHALRIDRAATSPAAGVVTDLRGIEAVIDA